jgi:hypothetical protein
VAEALKKQGHWKDAPQNGNKAGSAPQRTP